MNIKHEDKSKLNPKLHKPHKYCLFYKPCEVMFVNLNSMRWKLKSKQKSLPIFRCAGPSNPTLNQLFGDNVQAIFQNRAVSFLIFMLFLLVAINVIMMGPINTQLKNSGEVSRGTERRRGDPTDAKGSGVLVGGGGGGGGGVCENIKILFSKKIFFQMFNLFRPPDEGKNIKGIKWVIGPLTPD